MAILINTAEGGSNATVATTANTGGGSGTVFDQVTGSVTFSTTSPIHGSLSYTASAATQYTRWSTTDTTVLTRVYFKTSDASLGATPLRVGLTTGSVFISVMNSGLTGRIQLYSGSAVATSPSAISSNTVYRLELYVKAGAGTGELRAAVYEGNSTTAWWDSGAQTGRTVENPATILFGKFDSSTAQVSWDDTGAKTGSDATWGAWPAAGGVPTARTDGYVVVAPGGTFTLSGTTSSSPNGSITGWSWTSLWPSSGAPTLSGASTNTATGAAGANGSVYVYQLSITDSTAQTDTETVNVLVTNGGSGSGNSELVWNGTSWV